MALTACGIKIAINGSETDVDVEADSADWLSKVGKVRHQVGGGSFWRSPQPGVANLDIAIPLELAPLVRTVTIAVTCIPSATLPTGAIGSGAANGYRIIFHGDVQSTKGAVRAGDSFVQVDAVSEMSGLMGRKARTAAAVNTGPRTLLNDIATAHGLTINGQGYFPIAAEFANLDRPAQKQASNGEWIRMALAGSGINMSEDWETSLTAPALMWRPDMQDYDYHPTLTSARIWTWDAGYPWLYSYGDVGMQYEDFVATVNIDGENSAGTQHYGYGSLSTAADRASVGKREITLTTWMDTAADCETNAKRMIAFQGKPTYMKLNQVTFNTEHIYRIMLEDETAGKTLNPEVEIFTAAAGMPGDFVRVRSNGLTMGNSNADYRDWPAHAPVTGTLYDTLEALWEGPVKYAAASYPVEQHVTRAITREFTPQGGWNVTVGLDRVSTLRGSMVTVNGSGTY